MHLPFLKNTKISGITLFPFIFVKTRAMLGDEVLLNHEKIHIRQQAELLVVFFYLLYISEYVILLLRLKNAHLAYRAISFEREAYAHEGDFSYLNARKPYAFLQYYKNNGADSR